MDPQIKRAIVIEACARAAHEVNRAYCLALRDESQVSWETAPAWVRESALAGVRGALGCGATPEQTHEAWCAHKRAEGWVHGPVKDGEAKTHPCLVPYAELPEAQKRKDGLYLLVVQIMAAVLDGMPLILIQPAPALAADPVQMRPGVLYAALTTARRRTPTGGVDFAANALTFRAANDAEALGHANVDALSHWPVVDGWTDHAAKIRPAESEAPR